MKEKKVGRPSSYSSKIADLICQKIIEGLSIHRMCKEIQELPSEVTIYSWMAEDTEFLKRVAFARLARSFRTEDEVLEIADDTAADDKVKVARDKLRVEARLKVLAATQPKKYGARVMADVEIGYEERLRKSLEGKKEGLIDKAKEVLERLVEKGKRGSDDRH